MSEEVDRDTKKSISKASPKGFKQKKDKDKQKEKVKDKNNDNGNKKDNGCDEPDGLTVKRRALMDERFCISMPDVMRMAKLKRQMSIIHHGNYLLSIFLQLFTMYPIPDFSLSFSHLLVPAMWPLISKTNCLISFYPHPPDFSFPLPSLSLLFSLYHTVPAFGAHYDV